MGNTSTETITRPTIKTSELRLGNWVFGHNPATMAYKQVGYFKVDDINEEGVNTYRVDGFDTESAYYEPIPLTPELLEKCGFELNKKVYRWHKNTITICNNEDNTGFYWDLSADGGLRLATEWKDVNYLHQLQNLFFALTGEELQIEL